MRPTKSAIMMIYLICGICLAQTSSKDEYIDYIHFAALDEDTGYPMVLYRLYSNGTLFLRSATTHFTKKETSSQLYNKTLRELDNYYFKNLKKDESRANAIYKDILCLVDTREKPGIDGHHGKGLYVIAHINDSKIRFVTINGAPRRGPFVKIRTRLKMATGVIINTNSDLDIEPALGTAIDFIYGLANDLFQRDNSDFIIFDGINDFPKDSHP